VKYCKLTDKNNRTFGGTQWGEGVTYRATGDGNTLCSKDVIHVYDHPLKAVMFNPVHADFKKYNLWECRVGKVVVNDKLKVGVKQCTTIRQIEAPVITTEQRVRFAIYCALKVYHDESFEEWANNWLSGQDRSAEAAEAAAEAVAEAAAEAAGAAVAAAEGAAE